MSSSPGPGKPASAIGGYVLEAKIGEGGMGAVYRARHPSFPGRAFALKVLLSDGHLPPEQVDRFQREMQALAAATQHPNVVKIHGGSIDGARPFYVMELVEGRSLANLARSAPLEPERAARILREVADAIAHVNARGIVHRDLKPENILIEAGDRPRVCDFGLARVVSAQRLTRTGEFLGTPAYAAPEQLDGRSHEADGRADVYGLGGVLFFALSGRAPFEGATGPALLTKVLVESVRPPSSSHEGVPASLDAVCLKALAKDPERRYASAAELRDDLDRFLRDEPVSAKLDTAGDHVRRASRRTDVRMVVAGGVVVAVAAVAGLVSARAYQRKRADAEDFRAAMAAGASTEKIATVRDVLREHDPGDPRVAELDERLAFVSLAERLGAGLTPEAIDGVARDAIAHPSSTCLVGERPDFALGDGLLAAADKVLDETAVDLVDAKVLARHGALVGLARELAERRIALDSRDGPARALRGFAELAALRAPRAPLARGRRLATLPERTLSDLAAARDAGGPVASRAAWLLVDLLAGAHPPRSADTARALEAARRIAPGAPGAAVLERAATRDLDAALWHELLEEIRAGEAGAASCLAIVTARAGLPHAFEHPELVGEDGVPERAMRFDPIELYAPSGPAPLGSPSPELAQLIRWFERASPQDADIMVAQKAGGRSVSDVIHERIPPEQVRRLDAQIEAAIVKNGLDSQVLEAAGNRFRFRLSAAFWNILACGGDVTSLPWISEYFCDDDIKRSQMSMVMHHVESCWWTYMDGIASSASRCAAFDRAFEKDVRSDPLVIRAVEGGKLARERVDDAIGAATALRRIQELDEAELAGEARDALAFEALPGLEALDRLGGPLVLPWRARLHRLLLAGPPGERLALLDVLRAERLAASVTSIPVYVEYSRLLLVSANALAKGSAAMKPHVLRVFDLAGRWAREEVHCRAQRYVADDRRRTIALMIRWRLDEIQPPKGYLKALGEVVDDQTIRRHFEPVPDDGVRAVGEYEFHPPGRKKSEKTSR